ncbi:MAG: PLP-dependent transferase [Alphaproteobacteria bacterium]|jgi:cystathionine gamma-synthase|nr:PLP-dependent transferase [Alphaproteobacteria bacterium]MBT4016365.1 PLP-dependent transferase [Alphaproteobacteria bacterium]MBT4966212.1 PLP-dependent transferase [Alphaproteobacteria bacterium]MBT5159609.1 PLP-dependent transferase [Alphaproteobacteria bacterium]MBT5919886.1 PLP-dependent transferase [Alphaproteobacteria bacterium]
MKNKFSPETMAAQAMGFVDPETKGLTPPVHTSTTYLRDADNQYRSGLVYSRDNNPTYNYVEDLLSELEGGDDAMVLASGMAAATCVFMALTPGDHVVAPKVMYWSLRNWLDQTARRWGLDVTFVDTDSPADLQAAVIKGKTKLVWIETPANPMWSVTDIAQAATIAHEAGAQLAVDSTVATPVHTCPISFGADYVMHSATKYLNGHSDVIAGALITAKKDTLWENMRQNRGQMGAVLGPFEAIQLLRGMRTLFLRVRQSSQSAQQIAETLRSHNAISEVLYPGLPDFPGHDIAARQMKDGFGGMLSIRLKAGEAAAIATAAHVQLWHRATSLGGVESLLEHRGSIEGAGSPVPLDLLRLSVGIEDPEDLISDLNDALNRATT